jgi:hypothetical protein
MSSNPYITIQHIKNKCIGNNEYIYLDFNIICFKENHNNFLSKMCSYLKYVYIFTGDKNLGKTHIANMFHKKKIYETYYSSKLPDKMNYDIVIINQDTNQDTANQYISHKYNDIISRYNKNTIFISVHFSMV